MNFEKKYFTRSALTIAALMFAGCAAGTPPASADVPAKTDGEASPAVAEAAPATAETATVVAEEVAVAAPAQNVAPAPTDLSALSPEQIEVELKTLSEATGKIHLEKTLIESRLGLAMSENEKALQALSLEKMQLDAARADFPRKSRRKSPESKRNARSWNVASRLKLPARMPPSARSRKS